MSPRGSRPLPAVFSSPKSGPSTPQQPQPFSPGSAVTAARHVRGTSSHASGTFTPTYLRPEALEKHQTPDQLDGEGDFSGKRYVWVIDQDKTFVRGEIVQMLDDGKVVVMCDDDTVRLS